MRKGSLHHYVVTASNEIGTSPRSAVLSASAGLPGPWKSADIGKIDIPGYSEFDGARFTLEGVREQRFVIMIGIEDAKTTLMDRADRIGRGVLPIDQASIPKL